MEGAGSKNGDEAKEKLVSLVSQQTEALEGVLEKARSKVKDSVQDFVKSGVSVMGQAIGLYYSLFKSVDVVCRPELEALFKQYFHHRDLQEAVTELEDVEAEWDQLLEGVDREMSSPGAGQSQLVLGSTGLGDTQVQDVQTGKMSTVGSYLSGDTSLILVLLRHFA